MADPNPAPNLPAHIEESIRSIAQVHADHHQNATAFQRSVDRMTSFLGSPAAIGVLTAVVVGWVGLNLLNLALGNRPIDVPPWVGGAVSLVSLYMVVLILATQRREDQLAQRREQLTLELVLLSEQKTAKVIELLEEVRRDTPHLRDRVDREADAMAQPAHAPSVLDAIEKTHAQAEQNKGPADLS